jgi:tRNA pseudouridine38-40 synthase
LSHRYFIQLAYNGSNHSGWQRQENAPSIQEDIEKALSTILRQSDISILGCGRTDAGVHAKKFFAHVDMEIPAELDLKYRLNQFLSKEICIQNIIKVDDEAHTRFDARERTYEYKIHFEKDPFKESDSSMVMFVPDIDKMNEAASKLVGTRDFTSFAKVDNDAKHHMCDLFFAKWETETNGMTFRISANRFLRNMVRAVVGTLLEVGNGKRSVEEFEELIGQKNRNLAGTSAPAKGLALIDIKYPYVLS